MCTLFSKLIADYIDDDVMRKILFKHMEFKSLGSLKGRDGRLTFTVESPCDFETGEGNLIGDEIKINGKVYTVLGVEAHVLKTIKKGTKIGLWVK